MELLNTWIITDPNTGQRGRKTSDFSFVFEEAESGQIDIDLRDYTETEIEETINTYGYTLYDSRGLLTNIHRLYAGDTNWIIAECLFETAIPKS